MSHQVRLSDLAADEQLLDRLGSRSDASHEPVALLLAAIARHADAPVRTSPAVAPGRYRPRRALTALTALVVGASGAGVAAAVTGPGHWLGGPSPRTAALEHDPPRTLTSPGLPRITLPPSPDPTLASEGYTLVRDAAGQIVLLPPKVVVAAEAPASEPSPEVAQPEVAPDVVAEADPDEGALETASWVLASPPGTWFAAPPLHREAPPVTVSGGQFTTESSADEPPPTAASASKPGAAKAAPPASKPVRSEPRTPDAPVSDSQALTMTTSPAEPPGAAIAAERRPSTPGTESGPGVPADPGHGEQPSTPGTESGPGVPADPGHGEQPPTPGTESGDHGPAAPGKHGPGAGTPERPTPVVKPTRPTASEERREDVPAPVVDPPAAVEIPAVDVSDEPPVTPTP